MDILSFLVTIVLLVMVFSLRNRVERLEHMQGKFTVPPATNVASNTAPVSSPATASTPGPLEQFGAWLKEDWLLKLGALLLLIGFGWLASYAFAHNWIGPMGRIALGLVAGALFMILGWWRALSFINQGSVFLVLGSTVVLLTTFAAREIYDFFTPLSALAVMFLSSAFVALSSVKLKSRSLSLASLILAGVAPLLTNSPTDDYVSLFAYLLVVVLGAIWIVALTGNRALTTAALVLVTLYSLPHLVDFTSADRSVLLLFAYAFSSIFFLANVTGIIKNVGRETLSDIVTALGNGLFLLAWITEVAPREWQSLIISAWMLVFVAGAFLVFKMTKRQLPFFIYAGVGVIMLAAATAAELRGPALTIAYTIECAVLNVLAYLILRNIKIVERLTILFAVPVAMSVESMNSLAWTRGVVHEDFFVLLVLGLSMFGLGLFLSHYFRNIPQEGRWKSGSLLIGLGSLWLYILLWLSLHAALENEDMAVMTSLITFTIIGLVTYFKGLSVENRALRVHGTLLLVFVVGRLLTVDVWKMELNGKIITFFLVGALLVSTAFLGKRKKASEKNINQISQ
jgi:uncharacterized membrane protein